MNDYVIYSIGFLAQILFSLRFLIQWLRSEKHKQIVIPGLFWVFSLMGALLLFFYGYLRNDFAIMLGQTITYFIYIRNLQLQNLWSKVHLSVQISLIFMPLIFLIYTLKNDIINLNFLVGKETISNKLLVLGVVSQIIFSLRFVYQWIYSEKNKISSLPLGFWVLSSIGSILIIIYALYRKDPVLLIANLIGTILYSRNIFILKNQEMNN